MDLTKDIMGKAVKMLKMFNHVSASLISVHHKWLLLTKCILPTINYAPLLEISPSMASTTTFEAQLLEYEDEQKLKYSEIDKQVNNIICAIVGWSPATMTADNQSWLSALLNSDSSEGGLNQITPGYFYKEMKELQREHLRENACIFQNLRERLAQRDQRSLILGDQEAKDHKNPIIGFALNSKHFIENEGARFLFRLGVRTTEFDLPPTHDRRFCKFCEEYYVPNHNHE